MQHQRRLAGRGRATNGVEVTPTTTRPPWNPASDIPHREGARDGVELVAGLDQAEGRAGVEIGSEGDHQDVPLERPGVGLHRRPTGSMEVTVAGTKRTPSPSYGCTTASGTVRPNITSSFEKPNTNPPALSISVMSAASPSISESRVVSSRPPNPAPSTRIRIFVIAGCATMRMYGLGSTHPPNSSLAWSFGDRAAR